MPTTKLPTSALLVASEVTPVVKSGGLADVVGALPIWLKKQGIDARVIIPAYPQLNLKLLDTQAAYSGSLKLSEKTLNYTIFETDLPETEVPLYLVSLDQGLASSVLYPKPADGDQDRFPLFCLAVADWLTHSNWQPQLVHCHDWMTGLLPVIIKDRQLPYKTILTIHNLAYQGKLPRRTFSQIGPIGVPVTAIVNLLKIGILAADTVNTVSPTYAEEILTRQLGRGLDAALRSRRAHFSGILNGIDYRRYAPYADPLISTDYTMESVVAGKQRNKHEVQVKLGLPESDLPLLALVSRLDPQKGFDLVINMIEQTPILQQAQLVIMGTGHQAIQRQLERVGRRHHHNLSLQLKFDEALAHQLYAASDFFLIPSKFEPCGLTQMIAMKYGSIPVARQTGGLADSIVDQQKIISDGTGILFESATASALYDAIKRGLELYANKQQLHRMIERTMRQDFSWEESAKKYKALYQRTLTS